MSDSVKGPPAGYRTTFAKIMRILAMVTGTLVAVQFALAGFGAFGSFHNERDWDAHETLGTIIGVFTLVVLITALVARPGTRALVGSIVLFVLAAPIQPILAAAGKNDSVGWGALHAFTGVVILAMCGLVSRKIDLTQRPAPTPTPTASVPS